MKRVKEIRTAWRRYRRMRFTLAGAYTAVAADFHTSERYVKRVVYLGCRE